jgi:hypothetical protein
MPKVAQPRGWGTSGGTSEAIQRPGDSESGAARGDRRSKFLQGLTSILGLDGRACWQRVPRNARRPPGACPFDSWGAASPRRVTDLPALREVPCRALWARPAAC